MLENKNFMSHAKAQRRKELQEIHLFSRHNLIHAKGLLVSGHLSNLLRLTTKSVYKSKACVRRLEIERFDLK